MTGDSLDLRDDDAESLVTICPSRGAIVTRFRVGDRGERELLYLDESTLLDPGKNVRGGIPLLFPSPGKLAGDRYARGGHAGSMKQHGFARDVAWQVKSHEARGGTGTGGTDGTRGAGAATATLAIESSDATRAMYPWDFRAEITYTLRGRCLRLDFAVENTGAETMPFGFGVHPYFRRRRQGRRAHRHQGHARLRQRHQERGPVPRLRPDGGRGGPAPHRPRQHRKRARVGRRREAGDPRVGGVPAVGRLDAPWKAVRLRRALDGARQRAQHGRVAHRAGPRRPSRSLARDGLPGKVRHGRHGRSGVRRNGYGVCRDRSCIRRNGCGIRRDEYGVRRRGSRSLASERQERPVASFPLSKARRRRLGAQRPAGGS